LRVEASCCSSCSFESEEATRSLSNSDQISCQPEEHPKRVWERTHSVVPPVGVVLYPRDDDLSVNISVPPRRAVCSVFGILERVVEIQRDRQYCLEGLSCEEEMWCEKSRWKREKIAKLGDQSLSRNLAHETHYQRLRLSTLLFLPSETRDWWWNWRSIVWCLRQQE
jgi:hypothetical protein